MSTQLGQVFNVREFGAIGDDTADDGPAVRSALAAAIAVPNGVVHFPPGTYLMGSLAASTDAIDLASSNNLTLTGAGIGLSTIKMGVASWRSVIRGDQSDFIRIQDLTIDGNKASFAGSPGIGLRFLSSAANNIVIDNVEVINTDDRAMSITAKVVWVNRCDVHDCDGGIGFNVATDSHVWLTDSYIRDIGTEWTLIQDGVFFGGQYLYAAGNTITRCTDTGINIGGDTSPTGWARVIGNTIFQIGNSGVNTGGGDNQIIKDNIIFACGRKDAGPRSNSGVRIRDDSGGTFTSVGVLVQGNRIYEDQTNFPLDAGALGQDNGIEIVEVGAGGVPDNISIIGNDLRDNDVTPLLITDQPASLIVRDNLGLADFVAEEIAAAVTLDATHRIVNMESTAATRVVTLPDNATFKGHSYLIRRDGSNTVTIDRAGSDTFDDADIQKTLDSDSAAIGIFSIGDGEWKIVATEGTVGGS